MPKAICAYKAVKRYHASVGIAASCTTDKAFEAVSKAIFIFLAWILRISVTSHYVTSAIPYMTINGMVICVNRCHTWSGSARGCSVNTSRDRTIFSVAIKKLCRLKQHFIYVLQQQISRWAGSNCGLTCMQCSVLGPCLTTNNSLSLFPPVTTGKCKNST